MEFAATQPVRDAVAAIGRTEDLCLSPDGRCLAVAGINADRVLFLNLSFTGAEQRPGSVMASSYMVLRSSSFHYPHGLTWITDEKLVVANRSGDVCLIDVPRGAEGEREAEPFSTLHSGDLVSTPGSVSLVRRNAEVVELLVCNNYADNVSRHLLDAQDGYSTIWSETLLTEGLRVPDGVAHSRSGKWVAVSNHYDHSVFIYDCAELERNRKPAGVLRGIAYPHGLRFTPDDRAMLVADAGAPVVHVFGSPSGDWRGSRLPGAAIEVVPDEDFKRGHVDPENGGPKGVELLNEGRVLIVTCEEQPLALFDIADVVERVLASSPATDEARSEESIDLSLSREFLLARLKQAQDELRGLRREVPTLRAISGDHKAIVGSLSWRITEPLRRGRHMLSRFTKRAPGPS